MKFPRLVEAQALPGFQLWIRFQDDTEGVIDFREHVALPVMRSIATPEAFARVRVAETGSYLYWDVDVPPMERPDASSDWLYLQTFSAEVRHEFETLFEQSADWSTPIQEFIRTKNRTAP